jgi:hypothetical protein
MASISSCGICGASQHSRKLRYASSSSSSLIGSVGLDSFGALGVTNATPSLLSRVRAGKQQWGAISIRASSDSTMYGWSSRVTTFPIGLWFGQAFRHCGVSAHVTQRPRSDAHPCAAANSAGDESVELFIRVSGPRGNSPRRTPLFASVESADAEGWPLGGTAAEGFSCHLAEGLSVACTDPVSSLVGRFE